MALNIDIGSPWAESMVDYDQASWFIARHYGVTPEWAALSQDEAEALLRRAIPVMNLIFPWRGYRYYKGQAMPFPRRNWPERQGYIAPSYEVVVAIPDAAKEIQSLLAYDVLLRQKTQRPVFADDPQSTDIKSLSLGGLSVSVAQGNTVAEVGDDLAQFTKEAYSHIYAIAEPLISSARHLGMTRRYQKTWTGSSSSTTTFSTTTSTTSTTTTSTTTTSTTSTTTSTSTSTLTTTTG
jgi:hypothetical protein